jgi:SNF2 family DNA or RNA helicase
LLDALDRALAADVIAEDERRFSWSVRLIGGRLEVELWQQTAGKRGRFGQRRRVSPELALEGLGTPALEADRRALALYMEELERNSWDPRIDKKHKISEPTARRIILALAGHPRVFCPQTARAGDDGIALSIEADRLGLSARGELDGSIELQPVLEKSGRPRADLMELCTRRIPGNIIIELDEDAGSCRAIELSEETRRLLHSLRGRLAPIPAEARTELLERLPKIAEHLPVRRDRTLAGSRIELDPSVVVRVAPLGVDSVRVSILIEPAPGLKMIAPGSGAAEMYGMSKTGDVVWVARELERERAIAGQVIERLAPLAKIARDDLYIYDFTGDDALALIGALERKPELRAEWVEGTWRPRIKRAAPEHLRLVVRDQRDWFSIDGLIELDHQEARLAALLDAVKNDRRHVQLSGDAWMEIGELLAVQLRRIADLAIEGDDDEVALSRNAPLVLSDLQDVITNLTTSARWRRTLDAPEDVEVPRSFRGTLRPYQLAGYRWMSRLAALELGACLADDMGLGKTIQAITMLCARASLGPALVVAPTSVGFNWSRELEQFAPHLSRIVLRELRPGERRPLLERLGPDSVVIISYELAVREIEALEQATFATLILDEAAAVKNADTDRARAIRRIDARWKLAMTGTPVENNAGDLWSLFRILSPGLLGSWGQFRERFLLAIEIENSAERRRALARLLRPFVLRRTKAEVAPELPAKMEIDVEVVLSPEERRRYHEARMAALAQLSDTIRDVPKPEHRFAVLAALTRLRQLACHPALVDAEWTGSSSKIETAIGLLDELRAEGHRALVFSQFTSLLDLLELALRRANISFVRLDGQTPAKARERRVSEFQNGAATAFLLSLKAGGTGLNLTAADYVFHLDPWWTPAAEDQATDRAHRIGQTKPLTVYRLIAESTIEEQILSVHAEKRELVRALLEGSGTAANLDTRELLALIKGV